MTSRVRVPASASNLGAGFDCIGMAVDRWLTAGVTLGAPQDLAVRRRGTLSNLGVAPEDDLLVVGFRAACRRAGVSPPSCTIDASSEIPVGRGLGSSAAAIVAGALLAVAALDLRLSRQDIVEIAAEVEGHPDNVAPAVHGGAVLSLRAGKNLVTAPLHLAAGIEVVIAVPPFANDTKAARAVLPAALPHRDAVIAAGRSAALVQGLATGDGALLGAALDDVLHVPYRRAQIYGYDAVVAAAKDAGAYGATLSGAGAAILAIAPSDRAADVGTALLCAWRSRGVTAELIRCAEPVGGAVVSGVPDILPSVAME